MQGGDVFAKREDSWVDGAEATRTSKGRVVEAAGQMDAQKSAPEGNIRLTVLAVAWLPRASQGEGPRRRKAGHVHLLSFDVMQPSCSANVRKGDVQYRHVYWRRRSGWPCVCPCCLMPMRLDSVHWRNHGTEGAP